ncbi:carboxylesterase/lipase family protein [Microbacterium hydrocarbonoxydans]|uniref:carboxylesterase/lipase family protein n=1 Tax=Microbacterium hydrocarbonoxydans TaxID=273678 RepID=UPI00204165B0|nr:carboxylesterase family protein [Microbacterium hydrocarbonoxydans]MCM3778418.1 carboxylesterase family protein [Microbacterium hydrocarbonoxydans]
MTQMSPTVRTESGEVRGTTSDALHVFRGIPYAAPPFGANRFRPPARATSWDGVRDATRSGVAAPQPTPPASDPWAPIYAPTDTGEDCLSLDIWTPELGATRLPVVVHIHGGGYVSGAGSLPLYSGRAFARDGIVHVSINYRLGIDGFLHLGEGHDNLGLRDQIAALEWVQRNIATFGGDPDRVTIMGQSAGGVSVFTHLAMPASEGLFHRAIAQSGSTIGSMSIDTAERQTRQVARGLRVAPTIDALGDVPLDRTVAAAQKLATRFAFGLLRGDPESLMITPFRAVHGTAMLPEMPSATAARSTVPLLTGTVQNETIGFIQALTSMPLLRGLARRGLRRALGIDAATRAAYASGERALSDADLVNEAAWTDWSFRGPTRRFVTERPGPSWLYEFRWHVPSEPAGAVHGIDLPFSADALDTVGLLGEEARRYFEAAPQALADDMHGAFTAFIRTGDPEWERSDGVARPRVFGGGGTAAG